jgi:hypothetical protein
VAEGDFVYLHFSGHGHQQPARSSEEIDGLDEVFMPRDTEIMRKGMTGWPNAYVDKDIKADIDAIRDKGAFVWAVFDCCHSATMTRNVIGGDSGEIARQIDVASLEDFAGLPETAPMTRAVGGPVPRQTMLGLDAEDEPPRRGGLVAFYASQTIEPTFEMPLPKGSENPVQMGLFTHTLLERMAENPAISYRQLGEAVLQSYVAMNRTRPIPMFEGDDAAMSARLFDAEPQDYQPQWQVRLVEGTPRIAAGEIHGLRPGIRLAVLPGPTATLDDALGLIEVSRIEGLRTTLGPASDAPHDSPLPLLGPADLPEGAWVRLTERPIDLVMTLALPAETPQDGRNQDETTAAIAVASLLREIAADDTAPFRIATVPAGQPADLHLDVLSRASVLGLMRAQEGWTDTPPELGEAENDQEPRLWILNATRAISLRKGQEPLSLRLERNSRDDQRAWLMDTLLRAYRATRIAALGVGNQLSQSGQVSARAYLKRGAEDLTLRAHDVPAALPMDQLWLQLRNETKGPVDVHALFIGADFSIVPAALPERLQAGNAIDRGLFQISDTSFGREHLVVIMLEPEPMAPVMDLSFLGQTGAISRGVSKGQPPASGLRGLLSDVGQATATRGALAIAPPQNDSGRGDVLVFSFEVTPN